MSHLSSTSSLSSSCDGNGSGEATRNEVVTYPDTDEPGQACPRSPLDFALEYARAGIPVFPVNRKTKKPITTHGFNDATTDTRQIEAWARRHPSANWAMPTGEKSGITALDVDPRHGGDDSLTTRIDEYGELPNTKVIRTGGGGLHIYFRRVVGLRNSTSLIAPGLDVRGDGGYVVIEGGIHESGDVYKLLSDEPLADMPAWMIELAMAKPEIETRAEDVRIETDAPEDNKPRATGEASRFARGGVIPDGTQNETLFRHVACRLRGRGAEYDEILAAVTVANDARCTGKKLDDPELQKLSKSAMRYPPGRAAGMASRVVVRREPDARAADVKPEDVADSPHAETLRIRKVVSDENLKNPENARRVAHGFGGARMQWDFPTASVTTSPPGLENLRKPQIAVTENLTKPDIAPQVTHGFGAAGKMTWNSPRAEYPSKGVSA